MPDPQEANTVSLTAAYRRMYPGANTRIEVLTLESEQDRNWIGQS